MAEPRPLKSTPYPCRTLGLAAIFLAGVAVLWFIAPFDYDWTVYLRDHSWPTLKNFAADSLFEGEGFGAGDPVIFLLVLAAAGYWIAWKGGWQGRLDRWRPQLGYVLTSAAVCSLYLAHGLKFAMGRARPKGVLRGKLPFTEWYDFGPHFLTEGMYHGSFPSGHTMQVFLLMSVAYVLAADPTASRGRKAAGWLWGAVVLAYAAFMGAARCMTGSHWVTDSVGGVVLAWLAMHALYFRVLDVPGQSRYFERHGRHPTLPSFWELRFCAYGLFLSLGLASVLLGVRSLVRAEPLAFAALVPVGFALAAWAALRLRRLGRTRSEAFAREAKSSADG